MSHADARAAIAIAVTDFVGVLVMGSIPRKSYNRLQCTRRTGGCAIRTAGSPAARAPDCGAGATDRVQRLASLLPCRVDVQVHPWVLPVCVLPVAKHPRLQQGVLDRVYADPPRVVRGDELGHLAVDPVALRP